MKKSFPLVLIVSLCISLGILSTKVVNAEDNFYAVGIVPQFGVKRIHQIWKPILDELQRRTGYNFIIHGTPTIPDFEKEFIQGNFDFAYMNPYHALVAAKVQSYSPILSDQGHRLHGILVVRQDNPVKSPAELDGQRIAFPAPNALGASLLMRAEFEDIYHISIEPVYVKTHSSVYLNVVMGLTEAGGGVQKTLIQQPADIQNKLRVLHKTSGVASHPITVHPRVPEQVKVSVLHAMLEMGQSEEGRKLLSRIPMNSIGKADISDYYPISSMKLERLYKK